VRSNGRVIDADVELSKPFDGRLDDVGGAVLGADVGDDRCHLVSRQLRTGFGQAFYVSVGRNEANAGFGEAMGQHPTNAACSASHDGDTIRKVEADVHAPAPCWWLVFDASP
jgi:hypothetical protein